MKKLILIVEDQPEEIAAAKEAVRQAGMKPVVATTLSDAVRMLDDLPISIVLTDLHFPESESLMEKTKDMPCGLAVVLRAISKDIPVGVCSDINHHFAGYLKSVITDLQAITGNRIAFIMDSKDWQFCLNSVKED